MNEKASIYVLRCGPNGRVYVGSAKDGKKRILGHFKSLIAGNHVNSYLQRAFNKYGREAFTNEIVEVCLLEDRWLREQHWINALRACDRKHGFNVMHSAQQLQPSPVMSKKLKAYWKKRWSNVDYAKARVEQLKSITARPEVKEKMRADKLARWQDGEYRKLLVGIHKDRAARPEVKAQMKSAGVRLWQDPEYREKQMAERKLRFADPAFRLKLSIAAKNRRSKLKVFVHDEIV